MSDTWNYRVHSDPEIIPDEWVWERLRNRRNLLLRATDFRVVADAPWDTAAWVTYRQQLRDLPSITINPREALFPTPPTA